MVLVVSVVEIEVDVLDVVVDVRVDELELMTGLLYNSILLPAPQY